MSEITTHKTAISLMHHINTKHAGNKRQFGISNNKTGMRANKMTPRKDEGDEKPLFMVIGNDLYRLAEENIK